jgi:hypothetical protein
MPHATEPHPGPTHPALAGLGSETACPDVLASAEPDGLRMCLSHRDGAVDLELAGDLDLASAPRFAAAMAWIRRRFRQVIVVDTRGLDFVDLFGYRVFHGSLAGEGGERDPRIVYLSGKALNRFHSYLVGLGLVPVPRLS